MELFVCCALVAVASAATALKFQKNDKACKITFEGPRPKSDCAIYTSDK
jgi:hypothetical protein